MPKQETMRRIVVVRGLTFRATISQSAESDDSAVVLIHGIGISHRYLSRLHRELARVRTVVSIDLPGFGGLPKPPRDPDVSTMSTALGNVIAMLDLGPVVLTGHSMGVQWVVETALQRPELVTHVVGIGPVADVEHRTALAQTRALAMDTLGEPPWINAIVFAEYLRCGIPWYLVQLRHMLGYAIEDRVVDLSVPLLIIRGTKDPIAGLRWCRLLRDRAPLATLVLVPGHHVVQQSAPRAVASAILAHGAGAHGEMTIR